MFRSVWEHRDKSMSMMIPLLMQQKRDREELALKQQSIDLANKKLQDEADERASRLKEKIFETKIKSLQELHKAGYEKGDAGLVEATGRPLMGLGFPVAAQELPSSELDMTGQPNLKWLTAPKEDKPFTSIDQLIANLPGKTIEEKISLIKSKNTESDSKIKKLIDERDALPINDPKRKLYDDAIAKETNPTTRDAIYIETIDLGDKVRAFKKDGTYDDLPKSVSPSTIVTTDRRRATDEMGIRKEFTALPEVKNHVTIESQYQRLQKAMEETKTGGSKIAVDQALITILNKMLDPSSVVRESEYARTPQDMAFLSRLQGKIEKLRTGGAGLTNEEREAVFRMAENFYNVSKNMYDQQVDYYTDLAMRYGYDPENIVRLGGAKGSSKEQPSKEENKKNTAPQSAIDYLKTHPELKDDFKKKYGYLPEGF